MINHSFILITDNIRIYIYKSTHAAPLLVDVTVFPIFIVLYYLVLSNWWWIHFVCIHVGAVARFRDTTYSVVEGDQIFTVEIEKIGSTAQAITLSVQVMSGSATGKQSL